MPTSSSHYFKETIKGAERRGIDADLLLRDVGLTRREVFDPAWRGDVTLLARLVQLVWYALDDEHMGFLARPAKPGIFALMTHTLIAEQSVEQALRKGVLFYNLTQHESMEMALSKTPTTVRLEIRFLEPDLDPTHYFLEFWATIWYRLVGWLAGGVPPLREATFSYPRPAHYAHELAYIFRCPHIFDSTATTLVFDREFLQKPIVRDRAELKRFLSLAPLGFMTVPEDEFSTARQVRAALLAGHALPLNFPPLPEVARQLTMTEQTMRRRLRDESTSYRAIKENIRRDIAVHRLLSTSMAVERIGELVGYREARAFTRAFKQWTGDSPTAYRDRLAKQFRTPDSEA
ncbi:transcriptional regulator [Mycolicibacterium chitae]|uniref:HTH-type transcriptional regulator n=1 Tax=Mycolicibacterium chitae TaxID=1792 RepID=A0A3S4TLY9_MYCCI|nr:AraC family transcriptional regulator [Mycolicibacterium chitae]MCV7104993.1 AraC family transcriptional regulator [Mycolicibacterium chitae]BBZ04208.1 transcriptional regulator [Mycolicibacterium chitae]VEG47857.1 HTH-type transcriptional regulator [Mycolicibacterium chitae]